MRKPIFVVMDDDPTDAHLVAEHLRKHPLNPEVYECTTKEGFLSRMKEIPVPTAVFYDFWLGNTGDYNNTCCQLHETLYQNHTLPRCTSIAMTSALNDRMKASIAEYSHISMFVEKNALIGLEHEKVLHPHRVINEMIRKRLFYRDLTVGVMGLGRLGLKAVAAALDIKDQEGYSHVKIRACTNFWRNKKSYYNHLPALMGEYAFETEEEVKNGRLELYFTPEGFFDDVDIAIICTGEHNRGSHEFNPFNYHDRKLLEDILMRGSSPKMRALSSIIEEQRPQGILAVQSNLVGVNLLYLSNQHPELRNRLTSFSPDPLRIRKAVFQYERKHIEKIFGKYIENALVRNTLVYGDHAYEFADLRRCYVYRGNMPTRPEQEIFEQQNENLGPEVPLSLLNPAYKDKQTRNEREKMIAQASQKTGLEALKSEKIWDSPSKDAQEALHQAIFDIVTLQRYPTYSMHTFVDGKTIENMCPDGYVLTPTEIDYSSSVLRCNPLYPITALEDYWKEEIVKQIIHNRELQEKYYLQTSQSKVVKESLLV